MTEHVVVVGAGAVGAVYAHHMKRAGAHVTLLVRPKYVDELKQGIRLWRGDREERLAPDDVVGDVAVLKGRPLDQVWLCVPSTGLDDDALRAIGDATGNACVVDLMPGLTPRSLHILGRERLVDGIIPFIAYQCPLHDIRPGHDGLVPSEAGRAPGIAYWLPPLVPTQLSGPAAARAMALIRRGGMSARVVDDAGTARAVGSALLGGVIGTIQAHGWSLRAARAHFDGATREAIDAMGRAHGTSATPLKLLATPWVLSLALWIVEKVAPLPLEPYIAYHFTKVGAQSRSMLQGFVDAADKAGLPAPHLRALARSLLTA